MMKLSKKESDILHALKNHMKHSDKPPTIAEILVQLKNDGVDDIKSSRTVHLYLQDLQHKGLVRRNTDTRELEIIKKVSKKFIDIPIYGSANCGVASVVAEQYRQGTMKISKSIIGQKNIDDLFAIQVSGESMNNYKVKGKKIEDGNFVLVDGSYKPSAKDHDIPVLAVIDGLATIKLLRYVASDRMGLFPCSTEKDFSPIYLSQDDDIVINGRIIDVLRS